MNRVFHIISAMAIVLGVADSALAERNTGYFEQDSDAASVKSIQEGYFFYTDEMLQQAKEPEKKSDIPPPTAPPETQVAEKPEYNGDVPWERLYTMHPKKFEQALMDQLHYAIQQHDQQKPVDDYVALQMVAIDRAENFQKRWGQTLNAYPALDTTVQRPISRVASTIAVQMKDEDMKQYIHEMRDEMGLLVFTKEGCQYCAQQKEILGRFIEEWGWRNMQEIDIGKFPEQAAEYGVSLVPDMYLVGNVKGEILRKRLRAGLSTKDDIEKGMLEAYSQWFMGRPYTPEPIVAGQEAFRSHYERLAEESREKEKAKKKAEAMDNFVKKYQRQRERKSAF